MSYFISVMVLFPLSRQMRDGPVVFSRFDLAALFRATAVSCAGLSGFSEAENC